MERVLNRPKTARGRDRAVLITIRKWNRLRRWCREGGANPHDRKGRRILSLFLRFCSELHSVPRWRISYLSVMACDGHGPCNESQQNAQKLATNSHQNSH